MQTKNAKSLTKAEREHLQWVKELPCSVCSVAGPCDAHHIKQWHHFTAVALCKSCHQDGTLGWHGARVTWRVMKMDELDALNVTLKRLAI
jgi:hypothetical protein